MLIHKISKAIAPPATLLERGSFPSPNARIMETCKTNTEYMASTKLMLRIA